MHDALKEACFRANMQLPKLDLVIYTFGNVSCVDREAGVFAIKPSGVDYDALKPEDMVVVSLESGKVVDGTLRPSSDTNTHLELYRAFPNIGGIVHTHSTHAVAWAQAHRDVPCYGTTHADHLAHPIPCTDFMADERIANDYETETGFQIIQRFREAGLNPDQVPMVLVAGHGPFAWGKDAADAVYHAKVLEELCRMAMFTEAINPEAAPLKASLINKHHQRKHGKDAYYGQK
ncbi:MAG: L-ribulose-5-phosphate 4-epimerase [Victivallales bacterium]|nr:L-ribulose-5-phosphate 4-epimerase [Victivallales bacterium]